MREDLVNKVGECSQDNLIAGLFPRALTTGVNIAAGAGKLARGTVLSRKEDGTCEVMATGGSPAYILAVPVDASGTAAVTAVAYRTGHLNRKALIVAEGYTMTAADEEELRKGGILLSDMLD